FLYLVATLAWLGATLGKGATLREHYPLDANGKDAQGLANLTPTGSGITFSSTGGTVGGYMHLAGTSGYLLASLDTGIAFSALGDYSTFRPLSVSFWVRQTAAQAAANTQAVFGMTTNTTNSSVINTGFEVATRESSLGIGLLVRARNSGAGDSAGQIATGVNVSDGNWHHVAITFEAGDRYVYIDNVLRGTNNTPIPITTNPIRYFAMGAFLRAGSVLDTFDGDIDDFQVYDGSFTAADVAQLYQNPGQTLANNTIPPGTAPEDIVDPMIGVAGGPNSGENALGACLPQSSIYPSPDTQSVGPGGYIPGSNVVGFSQLHASGAGASTPSFGNFLVSPRLGAGINESDDASPIENVVAHPYEFGCELSTWSTTCTVAPTANCAIYEFDFPSSTDARLNFDVARKIGSTTGMQNGSITIDPVNGIISGGGTFNGNWNPASYTAYFYAQVDTTPQSEGTFLGSTATTGSTSASTTSPQHMGGWLSFNTTTNRTVHLKIAVSFTSVARAQQYLQNEIPAWDLAGTAASAKSQWNSALSVVQVPGIGSDDARKLYTALFHSLITPRNRTGDPGNFPPTTPFWDDHYTCWDTWQTLYPLLSIVRPAAYSSIVNSFGQRFLINGAAETAFT
ncbi:MAG TPA: glycoside hydrolase domain-containing protein, partial [Steroidobacteraceae bacterium]